ncbi:uncharacterized protein PHACADRAFT_253903 [Phanerochaete carnosa HHB-10118-sp]|uniref:CFEM domain-containing protein n=1 Tax=Phanerochaete carnosa (strain HHB-10118-sp) TaxID=650164 RepID=K5WBR2_PHACS|nr:uncharacterized protein PHACADRAFT_253903 [Phanerochaete carnosa HHB-10118-sp]EKM56655.1 hypothetical protein PHACADRAFT_253903 [Phanerochaete carnosa HHB-10118-sp]
MRFTLPTVLFAGALSVSAVSLRARQNFPTCSESCVANPSNLFGCTATDDTCLCNSQQYVAETTQCIVNACDAADAASAEALSRQLCAAVGVTLTSTPTPSPFGSASGASSTPTGSSGSSTSAPSSSGSSGSAPAPTQSTGGAMSNGINVLVGAAAAAMAVAFTL